MNIKLFRVFFVGVILFLYPNLSAFSQAGKGKKEIYFVVDEMPQFPGGDIELLKFISKNLHLPKLPPEAQIHGPLYVRFVVKEDGYVDSVSMVRPVHPLWDAAAIQVIKLMPQWKPGRLNGKAVDVFYSLPMRVEWNDE